MRNRVNMAKCYTPGLRVMKISYIDSLDGATIQRQRRSGNEILVTFGH